MYSPVCVLLVNHTVGISSVSPIVTHYKSVGNSFLVCRAGQKTKI